MKSAVVALCLISTSTGANLRVPYDAFGYAHADSSTSTTNPSSSLSSSVPADSIGMNAMAPSSNQNPSTKPPALEHSMEDMYDQTPRFKATSTATVASGAGSFGYNAYLHSHHHLPADQVANQQNMAQALKNPLLYARDGGAYDAWKAAQTQQHADVGASEATSELSRAAALERFQRSQVTLTKVNEEPEAPEESEPEGDASGGATAPAEDELITAAEERVAKAQTNADALHTDVVGTALAIKDTLKETSSSVGDAHEEGPSGEDVLEHLEKAESSARQVQHLRDVQRRKKVADANAKDAVTKAQEALAALTEQRRVASEMQSEELQKQKQHEQDKIIAAQWPPVDGAGGKGGAGGAGNSGDGAGTLDNKAPAKETAPTLSKRQQLFKELGERLLRLAMPTSKRKELVDHLDDNIEDLKHQLNATQTEKALYEKQVKLLEKQQQEEQAKKRGDSTASKMSAGERLNWIETELQTATEAMSKMGPIADKIAQEAKEGSEEGEEEKETSLMEEASGETPDIVDKVDPHKTEEDEEDAGEKPTTVPNLAALSEPDTKDEETYATVVKDDPTADQEDGGSDAGEAGGDAANAANAADDSVPQVPEAALPVDPTSPGQRSVADQVYDALGGDETFGRAEAVLAKKAGGDTGATTDPLNSEPWKAALNAGDSPSTSSTATDEEGTTTTAATSTTSTDATATEGAVSPLEHEKQKLDAKDDSLPTLSTTKPEQYGEEEETVARMELVGAKKDAEVAAARVKYAQQRQVGSAQQEQLQAAIKMAAMQDRAVDVKKKYLQKAQDEALVSQTRLDAAEKKLSDTAGLEKAADGADNGAGNVTRADLGKVDGVQLAVRDRLKQATAARAEVVLGRQEDVEKEMDAAEKHKQLVKQIQESIKMEEQKEIELKNKRDEEVQQQQEVNEKVANAQARYGLRHDVQKLINSNANIGGSGSLSLGTANDANDDRNVAATKGPGEVAQVLAKEGKTFTDAAEWRLHKVRTGEAGPIHIPSPTTEDEIAGAVGAFVGAKKGASLGATHDITAAAASMHVAGVEQYPVLLEMGATSKVKATSGATIAAHLGFNLDTAADDALAEARASRDKLHHQTTGTLTPETLSRIATLGATSRRSSPVAASSPASTSTTPPPTPRFLEMSAGKAASRKTQQASTANMGMLEHATKLLVQANDLRKQLGATTTETGKEEEHKVMFHDLPSIKGDRLFEQTKKWLKTANPFDNNHQLSLVAGRDGGAGALHPGISNEERDMFLENSAQYRSGAILPTPSYTHAQPQQQQSLPQPPFPSAHMMQRMQYAADGRWNNNLQQQMFQPQPFQMGNTLPDLTAPLPDLI